MSQARCQRCNKPATVHLTEITQGTRIEVHLCDQCAAESGYIQQAHLPLGEMLNEFLQSAALVSDKTTLRCPDCGMTWQEFKDTGLLGCAKYYDSFANHLSGVIENAQRGATHHTGKAPTLTPETSNDAASAIKLRQAEIKRLRRELAKAVAHESYEDAARLRDQIKGLEAAGGPA